MMQDVRCETRNKRLLLLLATSRSIVHPFSSMAAQLYPDDLELCSKPLNGAFSVLLYHETTAKQEITFNCVRLAHL
jgi:hypothetical protein